MGTDLMEHADLVIAGAGIHGAAIANEAAARGFEVFLMEQFDGPAQGTSSRSSKLIHGGLRYLETFELGLVYECLADRAHLLEKYPDLVSLEKFYIPVYTGTTRSRHLIRIGLSLYALLGGLGQENRFRSIGKNAWQDLDFLNTANLKQVFQYYDAQTDDARLTGRLIEEAGKNGAKINFSCEFLACTIDDDGVRVKCRLSDQELEISGRFFVNASGPWVNNVIDRCQPAFTPLAIDLVQGTHIEIPGKFTSGIYYLEAPQDQRAVFAMPWKEHILMGTTERLYKGDPAKVWPTNDEIEYLLEVYNHYFSPPGGRLVEDDVLNSWAGLRVLPKSRDNPFKRSRETIFHKNGETRPRVFSIYGGKLTSHYSTATKLLKLMQKHGL